MANYVTQTSDKNKKTAAILCACGFLGIGGLHYFYVGRIGKGMLYLFTCGLFLIGTIMDLLSISTGAFRDNTGAPLRITNKHSSGATAANHTSNSVQGSVSVPSPVSNSVPSISTPISKIEMPAVSGFELKYSYNDVLIVGGETAGLSAKDVGAYVDLVEEPENPENPKSILVVRKETTLGRFPQSKLQDMVHDFRARGGAVMARISNISENKLEICVGYYCEVENEYSKLLDNGVSFRSFKLTGNRGEELQSNISLCTVGEPVETSYDFEKEKYSAICGVEIGFFPKSAEKFLEGNFRAYIKEVDLDENGKYYILVDIAQE